MNKVRKVWVDRAGSGYGHGAEVGVDGVTEIREKTKHTEPDCFNKYYEVYKNGQLFSELHDFSIVEYFIEPQ